MLDPAAILATLAVVTVKVTLLLALGAAASVCLRRASAACRHVLWTAVLGGVLVVALATLLSPRWGIAVRLPEGLQAVLSTATASTRLAEPVAPVPAPQTVAERGPPAVAPLHTGRSPLAIALSLLWLGGAGLLLVRVVAGQVAVRRLAVRAPAIPAGEASSWLDRLAPSGAAREARLIETDELALPATWGVFRPVIALPAGARDWPPHRLRAALQHELAHVRRRDALTLLGADVCCALLWFHPGVWLVARRMRLECEHACDDAVLATGVAAVGYAELLLDLASARSRGRGLLVRGVNGMADAGGLEVRLRAALDPSTPRGSRRHSLSFVFGAALFASLVIGGAQARASSGARTLPAEDAETEVQYGERVPFTPEQEERALARRFQPRDEREGRALRTFQEAARHEKQHAMDLVRERALWALSVAESDRIIAPLVAELARPDWRVRAYAAWALGVVGAPEARPGLTRQLADPVWRVRAAACSALAVLADARSMEDMLALLSDPAWQVRLPAAEYLGRIRTPGALRALREHAGDPHVAVRTAIETALGEALTR